MTESMHPVEQPQSPEEWNRTTLYAPIEGVGVMLKYTDGLPTPERPEVPTSIVKVDLDRAPKAIDTSKKVEVPAIPTTRTEQTTPEAAELVDTFDHTMRPEAFRALRAEVAESMGEAVVSRETAPKDRVEELKAAYAELRGRFSEEDQMNLWRYVAGKADRARAQKAGDGDGSRIAGENAGQAWNKLSPSARQAAGQYESLMNQLERAYHSK